MFRVNSGKIGIDKKVVIINIVLLANAFTWYFYAFNILGRIIDSMQVIGVEALKIWGVNAIGIAVSAMIAASLIEKIKYRISFLRSWMFLGIIFSLSPLILDLTGSSGLILVSVIFGVYFGIGMPVCMGYYADSTVIENRSRLGGIIFLFSGLGFFLLSSIGVGDVLTNVLILATWRGAGAIILFILKPDERPIENQVKTSYTSVLSNRPFLLYFLPWCMFSLVNYMAIPVLSPLFGEFAQVFSIIEYAIVGVSAVAFGFFADIFGRKRLAIMGFAMLGLGYAALGIFPQNMFCWYLYTILDGIAWGSFYTIFVATLWGDLAVNQSSERYYAIGSLPYVFSNLIRISIGSYVAEAVPVSAVFSFTSIFLFLAIMPLIYTVETLPEKTIQEREIKRYIVKAKKAKKKYV